MQSVWNVKKYDEELVERISKKHKITNIAAKLLISRGIQEEKIDNFLNGTRRYKRSFFNKRYGKIS